jgi:hypothetical protein
MQTVIAEPNPDAIDDKGAYEQSIVEDLAAKLKAFDPDKGDYVISLSGSYPETKLEVSGLNIRTEQPMEWEFELWKFWKDWGEINGTATVIYAQLAV